VADAAAKLLKVGEDAQVPNRPSLAQAADTPQVHAACAATFSQILTYQELAVQDYEP
jgi:hypothetical protein